MKSKNFYSKEILGVRVDFGYTLEGVVNRIETEFLKDGRSHIICTTNPEFIMNAQDDKEYREIINNSDLSVPDGSGVLFAKRYYEEIQNLRKNSLYPINAFLKGLKIGFAENGKIGPTVTGVELTDKLCHLSHNKNYSVFLLGGSPRDKKGEPILGTDDTATYAANNIKEKYPNVNIIGSTSKFTFKKRDDKKTIEFIHECMSNNNIKTLDILLVCYKQIEQEKWIKRNIDKIPASVSIGVGRTFEYLSGNLKIPHNITYKYNISWINSLINEPWRIKRVINAFPLFPLRIYMDSIKSK